MFNIQGGYKSQTVKKGIFQSFPEPFRQNQSTEVAIRVLFVTGCVPNSFQIIVDDTENAFKMWF